MLVVNFKAYSETCGVKGLDIARVIKEAANRHKIQTAVMPQQQDLAHIALNAGQDNYFKIFAQHADIAKAGAFNGSVSLEALKALRIEGVVLNHSEKRMEKNKLKTLIHSSNALTLKTIVCAQDIDEAVLVSSFKPWAVAVEPPELIGTGVSVSKAKPEVVRDAVLRLHKACSGCKILVGAGVASEEDVRKAMALGADGALISSVFVKSSDHAKKIDELLSAFH